MDPKDETLDPLRNFAVKSFRLDPEMWEQSVEDVDNMLALKSFFMSVDHSDLFICEEDITDKEEPVHPALKAVDKPPDDDVSEPPAVSPAQGPVTREPLLRFSLSFPLNVTSKVLCVSKLNREMVSKDNAKHLRFSEVPGSAPLSLLSAFLEEVALPLLSNEKNRIDWPDGMSAEALRSMALMQNQVLVVKGQTQGRTYLLQPDLSKDLDPSLCPHSVENIEDIALCPICHSELLQTCNRTIIEWKTLVGDFLNQVPTNLVLHQSRLLPEEEFSFWESRHQNLVFIDTQLKSIKVQQLAAFVEKAQSIFSSTLNQIISSVQSKLKEAEDTTQNLQPLQKCLVTLQTLNYPQLKDQVGEIMEEVSLLSIHSEFYCKPHHIVILLQEIANLFIKLSQSFLGDDQVLKSLVTDPFTMLEPFRLCIETLERLKESFKGCRAKLEEQNSNIPKWDFPSDLIFVHLDPFLQQLDIVRDVYSTTLDMSSLDQAMISGINNKRWARVIENIYSLFLHQVTVLSEGKCDATDPNDQVFHELLANFHAQVQDLECQLVTVLSQALKTRTMSTSVGKIVQLFGPILKRPLILEMLRHDFHSVWSMIQKEIDQTELMVNKEIQVYKQSHGQSGVYSGFRSSEVSLLTWIHQLEKRVQHSFDNHILVRAVEASGALSVSEKCLRLKKLLQDFRDAVKTQWAKRLEDDCDYILHQPVIQLQQSGILEIPCGFKLEAVLRELRVVKQKREMSLGPQTTYLLNCRVDFTDTHLSLSLMQSSHNQMVSSVDPVECPLIQGPLQDLNCCLSGLQSWTWGSEGLVQEVQKLRVEVEGFHKVITEAHANTKLITE